MSTVTLARTRLEQQAFERGRAEQREYERLQVASHYEHDPELFTWVLGRRMAYSVGVFYTGDEDLDTAQEQKMLRVRNKLAIRPGEKVLDVGCGWGRILLYLAQHTQGSFHGITLSGMQQEFALQRARDWGVAERVRIDRCHVEDLRLPPESYDVVIFSGSIVHMHQREPIHRMVGQVLRPGGRLLISDCYFPDEVRGNRDSRATDYIFATALGYCRLISLSEELALIERAGLDILHVEDLTQSYVLTVNRWVENIRWHWAEIEARAPGFPKLLQAYTTVGKLSFERRTALEYMILGSKGQPRLQVGSWPIPGGAA